MPRNLPPLKGYTDYELLEELARRKNVHIKKMPEQWCDDCANFRPWGDRVGEMPADFNPCSKEHKMHFWAPEGYGDDFGFYRRVCGDRHAAPEA